MAEQGEQGPEGIFEIIWHQHNPDDWMAEVKDTRTNEIHRVHSLEEMERFIQAHLRIAEPQPAKRQK